MNVPDLANLKMKVQEKKKKKLPLDRHLQGFGEIIYYISDHLFLA